jgi:serine/threonine protein kinase
MPLPACLPVHRCHAKGLIYRDIKPGELLDSQLF